MDSKFVLFAKLKKILMIFTTNIENVNHVICYEKNRDVLLAKSKVNQQKRNSIKVTRFNTSF